MYSLYIDTHDKKVTIVLFKNKKVLNIIEEESNNKHSQVALPKIKQIIDEANIKVKDLNEIIVVNGPGSFTGERIAVTIAKTMAYSLNIPIKTIDYLTILALNDNREKKYVSIVDRNGAFIGIFDNNLNIIQTFNYLNKTDYEQFNLENNCASALKIDYNKVYEYVSKQETLNPHEVKPLYIKGISALK